MLRRLLLTTLTLLPLQCAFDPADAMSAGDDADVLRVQAYLNAIHAMKARFIQVAQDGATSTGTVWLQRPGCMRLQYDPPSPLLLVAGSGLVMFYDASLQQTSFIPLHTSPLGILLQADIRLSGEVTVNAVERTADQLQLTLMRTAAPGDGSVTLSFADPPLALVQWTLTDAQRKTTSVRLYNTVSGGTFDQSLFQVVDPRFLR